MSRIGKIPVSVPKDVKVKVDAINAHVEGPKGKLDLAIPHGIKVEVKDDKLNVIRLSDNKQNRANHGTIRARLVRMIQGVSKGHKKDLEIQGIGFRAQLQGKKVLFNLGLSHPVEFEVPEDVKISVPTQTSISVEGADIVRVGQIAARLKALKPVEPYKGKGIKLKGQYVQRKEGKKK